MDMKTIVLASLNPVKQQAALGGFKQMFPAETFKLESVAVASGVSEQPQSDEETLQGAINRSRNASRVMQTADFWVGIEGGIEEKDGEVRAFAWVVVNSGVTIGKSKSATFFVPGKVAALIRQGYELGEADDIVFKRYNSKQENGAVGLLTGNVIDRAKLYEQAVILALIPFKTDLANI